MPSDWRNEYLSSIQEAEKNNPVNRQLVEACSQLADRVAALEAEKAVLLQKQSRAEPSASPTPTPPPGLGDNSSDHPGLAQTKLDLAEALRSRGQLQTRLRTAEDELKKLRSRSRVDTKRISDLTAERNSLASRLRDRNEELVEKNKLQVQDENLTLDLQINMVEQRASKVAAENKELVDRWMKRMGEEADAMNLANEPGGR